MIEYHWQDGAATPFASHLAAEAGGAIIVTGDTLRAVSSGSGRYSPGIPDVTLGEGEPQFLFLDALWVIEGDHRRKKEARDVELTSVEECLLQDVAGNPQLIDQYGPRMFEVLVASLLTKRGFSNVKLSRFSQDGGADVWAVWCDGEGHHTVVVEVKQRSHGTGGLAVVDRLNGVRDRERAERAILVTNSSFSRQAVKAYSAHSDWMALVDGDRLIGLLGDAEHWQSTPSGLWTRSQDRASPQPRETA